MGKRVSPTLIGTFVVGAVVLAVVAVAVFGSGRFFRQTYPFLVYFEGSVNGLNVGAPVKFKGVQIGSVKEIMINLIEAEQNLEGARIPVIIEIDADRLTKKGGRADLADPATIDGLIKQGLRAQLNTESMVTGVLYVALDLHPGTPVKLVNAPGVPYKEIPTVPTTLEQMRSAAAEIVAKLEEIEFDRLVSSATEAVEGLSEITNSPKVQAAADSLEETTRNLNDAVTSIRKLADDLNEQVSPLGKNLESTSKDAGAALREAEATLRTVRALLEPNSPTMYKVGRTLEDLAAAARAIRTLAEYLERNPSSLLRGKDIDEE